MALKNVRDEGLGMVCSGMNFFTCGATTTGSESVGVDATSYWVGAGTRGQDNGIFELREMMTGDHRLSLDTSTCSIITVAACNTFDIICPAM